MCATGGGNGRPTRPLDDDGRGQQRATAPRRLTVIAENLADDAVASVLTRLVFERRADGRWTIAGARRALLCRRGDVTDRFVQGPCP